MKYLKYGVNIVDMVSSVDSFEVYGAKAWQETRARIQDETLLNISNQHHRLTKDLYPVYPYPLLASQDWAPWTGSELIYEGHLILGAYHRGTGLGFGRVFPAEDANYIKLLKTGFEVFPNWRRSREAFTSFLFAATGGPAELISLGKAIAEREQSDEPPLAPAAPSAAPHKPN
jgi:hypothetical protein